MTRCGSRKWVSFTFTVLGLLGLSLLGAQTPTRANTYSYASQKRQINACVLVSTAASTVVNGVVVPENAVPYVFYMMDRRTDLKPAGWSFVNPLASSTVTPAIQQRWVTRNTTNTDTSLSSPAFAIGAPLTKNLGAYWEVNLDTISPSSLQQFDIVLLAYHNGATQFSPNEREMLRKYVDAGGTIWLEDEGGFDIQNGAGSHHQGQFVVDTAFTGGAVNAANLPSLATLHHPLVNFPFPLTTITIQGLGQAGTGVHHIAVDPVAGPVSPRNVVPVVWSGNGGNDLPLVSAGVYGAGHLVISSAGIATGINSYAGGPNVANEGGNSGAVSGENTLGVQLVDAEFAYNMIAWTSSVTTGAFNVRRTGGTREDIGSYLGTRWSTIPNTAPTTLDSGATIYKSVAFYVDGTNWLHAYDTSPSEDLDNDGNPDDGIPDYDMGSPYDEIWRVQLPSAIRYGPPTLFSVNNNGTTIDLVAVQGSNGVTSVYNAFPVNGNGILQQTSSLYFPTIAGNGTGNADYASPALGGLMNQHGLVPLTAPSPAYSDGILFSLTYDDATGGVTDTADAWRIFPTDPLTGNNVFVGVANVNKLGVAPTPQALPVPLIGMPAPVGPPTVGYVQDVTTGAEDKMVYVPTMPSGNVTTSGGGGVIFAHLFSVKNDPLIDCSTTGYVSPVPAVGTKFRATLRRGDIPWFTPNPSSFNGMRSLLPLCHRTSNGVTTDLIYDPTGATANSFQVAYIPDPLSGNQQLHQVIVIPNPALLVGDTLTADFTADWPGAPLPNGSGGSASPGSNDLTPLFRRFAIPNPNGNANGVTPLYLNGGGGSLSPDDLFFVNAGDAPIADRIYAIAEHFPIGNPPASQAVAVGTTRPTATAVKWMFYPNGPVLDENFGAQGLLPRLINSDTFNGVFTPTMPLMATDLETIGAPAYSNGVVYQSGWVHMQYQTPGAANEFNAAIIMAYKANPSMSFVPKNQDGTVISLLPPTNNPNPNPQNRSTGLRLVQPDIIHLAAGGLIQNYLTLVEDVNFTVDYTTNTITIYDCRTNSGSRDVFNVALPFQVERNNAPLGEAGNSYQLNASGYGVLDNLLWWMIVPINAPVNGGGVIGSPPPIPGLQDVQPVSGPTVIGNSLFYGTGHGHLASVDLSGITTQNGSQVTLFKPDGTPRMSLMSVMSNAAGQTLDTPIFNPPVGTTDVMIATTPQGITAFDNELTVIADNLRLIEVNYAGQATWNADSTQTQTVVGGSLASGTGNVAYSKISFARPNVARHSDLNDFIVADSGNNRVIQTNRGGIVSWEMHSFNNGMRFVRAGDPLTLNHPTDIQTYTLAGNGVVSFTSPITGAVYSSASGVFYSNHYLVADSGNNRLVEVVDAYDGNGNPLVLTAMGYPPVTMLRQLTFVTQTLAEQNKALRYRTVQEFVSPTGNLFMAGAVDNVALGGADSNNITTPVTSPPPVDKQGGSIMIFNRGGALNGVLASKITGLYDPKRGTHTPISGPTFFKEYEGVGQSLHYLLCDANGCYDLQPGNASANAQNGEAVVYWALYSSDYLFMTGRPLRASSMELLGQADYLPPPVNLFFPHYLITNRYEGNDNIWTAFNGGFPLLNVVPSLVHGEVFEVRSSVYFDNVNYPQGYLTQAAQLYTVISGNTGKYLYSNLPSSYKPVTMAAGTSAITWIIPREYISQANVQTPIKRTIGVTTSSGTSSFILEEPAFSDRPF